MNLHPPAFVRTRLRASALFAIACVAAALLIPASASASAGLIGAGLFPVSTPKCDQPTWYGNANPFITMYLGVLANSLVGGASVVSPQLIGAADHTTYNIVPDWVVPTGDASYDVTSHSVLIPLSVSNQIGNAMLAMNLGMWKTYNPQARHDLAVSEALLTHETMHAWQDCTGILTQQTRIIQAAPNSASALQSYVRTIELPAQTAQETMQRALGEPPRSGTWLTIDASGNPLPAATAVANMIRTHYDAVPTADGDIPGFKFPGFKFPGFKFPGYLG